MRNILIENNILRFAGRGWGKQRPDGSHCANIKGWDHYNKAYNFRIEKNIMQQSNWMMVHTGFDAPEDACVYEDNLFVQQEGAGFARIGPEPATSMDYTDEAIARPEFVNNTYYKL